MLGLSRLMAIDCPAGGLLDLLNHFSASLLLAFLALVEAYCKRSGPCGRQDSGQVHRHFSFRQQPVKVFEDRRITFSDLLNADQTHRALS